MCIVHSNHCNVIVGVFVCSVGLSNGPQFLLFYLLVICVISRGALGDAPRNTRALRSTGWEALVYAVTVKFPVFWSTSSSTWFAQAEAQFEIRSITQDDTRYYNVVSALDSATATRDLSLLRSPPNTGKYDAIKTFLTSAYDFPTMSLHHHCLD